MQMTSDNRGFYERMANLVLTVDVSWDVMNVAGKIISLDADLRRYGGVLSRHIGLNDGGNHFDVYRALEGRCGLALDDYSRLKDDGLLLRELTEIERELSTLSKRD